MEELTTEVTEEDIKNGVEDEFGVVYSRDGKRLLKCNNTDINSFKKYDIKDGTIVICNDAFFDIFFVEQISIPNSVTTIGDRVFYSCESLKKLSIPNSVTFMGCQAFKRCSNLQKIEISTSIMTIGIEAFSLCDNLKTIEIPNSVISIGDSAFENCSKLRKVAFHKSLILIGNSAFSGCSKLQQINIPDSVIEFGHKVFKDCQSLKQMELPKSLEYIGVNPFENCIKIELSSQSSRFVIKNGLLIDVQNNTIISCIDHHSSKIIIPKSITTIADSAFSFCENLKTITIPKSVLNIGACAFEGCISLVDVKLPNFLTSIKERLFEVCYSLQTIRIPNYVKTIGEEAFGFCESLTDIKLQKSVSSIEGSAFLCCQSLKDISLPETVTTIPESAFWGCESLETIKMKNSITSIGDYAFGNCKSLKKLVIPDSVKTIGKNIVENCNELKEYNIPERFRPNMKIDKIVIHNFRAFINATIEFNKFNCIIGKNDSGKSTIFAALEWFFNPQKSLGKDDLSVNSKDKKIDVEVYFSGSQMIPDSLNEELIYDKDYLNSDGYLVIKKYIDFHKSEMGYKIKTYPFDKSKEKLLSHLLNEELDSLYGKMFSDGLSKKLFKFETNLSNLDSQILDKEEKENYSKLYKMQISNTKHKIFDKIYNNYKNNGIKPFAKWEIFDNEQSNPFHLDWFDSYKFHLFSSNTPIRDYLNSLWSDDIYMKIEKEKDKIAKKITDIFNKDGNKIICDSEKLDFKKKEQINLVNEESLVFIFNDSIYVPLKNRGEGLQFYLKNAVFRLLTTDTNSNNHNKIFAFEEPETHLHPRKQLEMYKMIFKLSENPNYQVIITTHSPYIVKELANDNITPIIVKRDDDSKVSEIGNLEKRVLPYVSMNEMNYIAFDEPSIEYHIELFGYIHNKLIYKFENDNNFATNWELTMTQPNRNGGQDIVGVTYIKGVDLWFEKSCGARKYRWFETKNYKEERRTLPYCVRNNIDHPLKTDDTSKTNGHKAFVNNNKYFKPWIIKESIELMRHAIINNPDIFNDN